MTNIQLYLAIGIPVVMNAIVLGLFVTMINQRINDLRDSMTAQISGLEARMNARFDAMERTWRAELRRVEEVMDARLKHLEEH